MGVQTMSCHGGGGSGGEALSRQGSVYSLTLNEVENHLGEPLRSMNLDDLLRTVLPAAEPYAAATAAKKTVDEVWRDIQSASSGRQASAMGEMTLEDFLSRAGVSVDGADAGAHLLRQYQPPPPPYVGRPMPRPLGVGVGPELDAAYGFFSQVAGRKRGAVAGDGVVEKTVERRQKRMIKNRESAARSRARKQAYTNELENKISRLEEENESLREQLKKLEPVVQFMPQKLDASVQFVPQKLESLVQSVPQPEAKQQLRRSNSTSF